MYLLPCIEPLMGCLIDNLVVLLGVSGTNHNFGGSTTKFLLFLLTPVVWVPFLLGTAVLMQTYIPAYYAILTGGRTPSPQNKKQK